MPKTDPTISQDAREAAAKMHDLNEPITADLIRKGKRDNLTTVRLAAEIEAHLRTPATDTEAMRLLMEARGELIKQCWSWPDRYKLVDRIDALAKGGA